MDPQMPAAEDDSDPVGDVEAEPASETGSDDEPTPDRPPTWEPL
jgi:hypothetical protein